MPSQQEEAVFSVVRATHSDVFSLGPCRVDKWGQFKGPTEIRKLEFGIQKL
jgi:hypothetical protein